MPVALRVAPRDTVAKTERSGATTHRLCIGSNAVARDFRAPRPVLWSSEDHRTGQGTVIVGPWLARGATG
jgi:hypothetical protein